MVPTTPKRPSALAERIAAGKAEPISVEEREIVAALRADFEKKFGSRATLARKGRWQSNDRNAKKS